MTADIESILGENRQFPPNPEFAANARVSSIEDYRKIYKHADEDPESFWGEIADGLWWSKKWDKVLDWNFPDAKWFDGAETNLAVNCLDRFKGTDTWKKRRLFGRESQEIALHGRSKRSAVKFVNSPTS